MTKQQGSNGPPPPEDSPELEELLKHVRSSRGFDLTMYKRSTLARRIQRRLQALALPNWSSYQYFLDGHPEEYVNLFDNVLINVTSFFRDEGAWDFLRTEIIPQLIDNRALEELIRVWCAGVSSGEEAFGVAIAFAEVLGLESLRDRIKVYATDVDPDALRQARLAEYTAKQLEGMSPQLIERYFEHVDGRYVVHNELRRAVIFGEHDLVSDPPISRLDLLVCRNTLMYFTPAAQNKILANFHFALRDRGFLFLGKAETLLTRHALFRPVNMKWRVFQRVPAASMRERLIGMIQAPVEPSATSPSRMRDHLRAEGLEASPVATMIVDTGGRLILANREARRVLGIADADVGRQLHELQISYRPVELRAAIDQAYEDGRLVEVGNASLRQRSGEIRRMEIQVTPLIDGAVAGAMITFTDVTRFALQQEELQHLHEELQTALEELQATVEELETTNEEIQSTNEELETTNEELQSTNEELETINAELQSTNEELETMNEELQRRTTELNQVNAFLESIVSSLMVAIVVVDRDLSIQVWGRQAEDLWGLRNDEVLGEHILNLDIGFPVDQLRQPIRSCLASEAELTEFTVSSVNRRGRAVDIHTTVTPLRGPDDSIQGAVILMNESAVRELS